ncbi:MAG TPA: DUF1223 domain-containing protein [Kofleriaceae bacterium]|nr:DUF1223 domain-containing protein [Kofleriaceae bacterium]
MRAPVLFCLALSVGCARADGEPKPAAEKPRAPAVAAPSGPSGPIVVELFTSQGCSSCPPADALLARLARAGSLGDRAVAPLAFHVDYWNDLGWADPFSSPAWTERQHQYARVIDDRVYTPELVVGGAAGVIGSNLAAVTDAIQRAQRPAALAATARWAADAVSVTAAAPDDAEVWVAIWEDGTSTHVLRGENAGETLGSERVVRHLERAASPGQKASISVRLDPAWHAAGAVAFAQRSDRHIVASAVLPRAQL